MARQVGDVPTRTFKPGAVIFRQGDFAENREPYLVHKGRVEVRRRIDALLKVPGENVPVPSFADSRSAQVGDPVHIIGFPVRIRSERPTAIFRSHNGTRSRCSGGPA
jgi:CRP-like cAMP-binding protein